LSEVADLLLRDYAVYNALNLDGGGSTTLAMKDPVTREYSVVNQPSDPQGRAVASNLGIFAADSRTFWQRLKRLFRAASG
jgi:exopolysaccharide biosynthesis protein